MNRLLCSGGLGVLAQKAYRLGLTVWHTAYKTGMLPTHRLSVPVISIGNLTTGGTGKTPLVIDLATHLESRGYRVAVLSRGYRAAVPSRFQEASHPDYGDEPYLIQSHLTLGKVIVGQDRVYTGRKIVQMMRPDVVILDDGYQHRRLHRDVNILLWDGEMLPEEAHLLPVGTLREPLSAMARADIVLITKQAPPQVCHPLEAVLTALNRPKPTPLIACPMPLAGFFHEASGHESRPTDWVGRPLFLLSGIARPQSFADQVAAATGTPIIRHWAFPDHARYTLQALQPVWETLQKTPDGMLVTTEKDWVKLQAVVPEALLPRITTARRRVALDWDTLLSPWSLPAPGRAFPEIPAMAAL